MKSHILVTFLAVAAFRFPALATPPAEIHLGVSPFLSAAHREQLLRALPDFVLNPAILPGNTHVVVWDAWHRVVIADLTIPVLAFDSSQARSPAVLAPLAAVLKWLRAPGAAVPGVAPDSGALLAPEWLQAASATPSSSRARAFVLIGDPRYASPNEPAFDMFAEARYPADGHLALGLAESVFGLAEKRGRLERSSVHWCFFTHELWANELHSFDVERFWTLFTAGQGGSLCSFQADLPDTFKRVVANDLSPVLCAEIDPAAEKAVMLDAKRPEPARVVEVKAVAPEPVPAPMPPPVALSAPAHVEPRPETVPAIAVPAVFVAPPAPAPEPVIIPAGIDNTKIGIGIAWSSSVDLDLYVLPRSGSKEVYYRRDRTAEARLYRDETKANAGRYYEFIELTETSPDLSAVRVFVNYYGGHAAGVTGQVVLFDHGQIKVGTFRFAATRGNGGRDSNSRGSSAHWCQIDLSSLSPVAAPLAARRPDAS